MKRKAAAVLTAILAGGIFVWTVGQNRLYAFQNRSLSAENRELSEILADREQTIDEKTEEIKRLQEQLADTEKLSMDDGEDTENLSMSEAEKKEDWYSVDDQSEGKIRIDLSESRECEELESHLPGLPSCSAHAYIEEWGLDVEQTAKALRRHWEEGDRRDGYSVSLTLHSDMFQDDRKPADAEKKLQGMQEALLMLAGPEYAEMIREAMAQEGGCLWFVRLEQVGELTCCTFEVGEPAYSPIPMNEQAYTPDCYPQLEKEKNDYVYYYVAVKGTWEGREVKGQCFRIPYTFETAYSIGMRNYAIEGIDLNFDEKQDLLIYDVGYEGCWEECRALVWEEEAGQFAYFPSFPANVYRFEADRQRVVDSGNIGEWMSYVLIYEIINGEYVCTRKMVIHEYWSEYGDEVFEHYELSYYEMGELIQTHPLSSDWDERELQKKTLYPDMYELMCGN